MCLLGIGWALCFRTHNELTMCLLGKCTLAPSVSRTQVLLTKIVKLCSEICDMKRGDKLNNIAVKLSKFNSTNGHTGIPPPQQDTGGVGNLHDNSYKDSSPNYQNHQSCRTCMPQDNAQSLDHTLSLLTPAPPVSSLSGPLYPNCSQRKGDSLSPD